MAADLPLINVAEWSFISVARDTVGNIAKNELAVSNSAATNGSVTHLRDESSRNYYRRG